MSDNDKRLWRRGGFVADEWTRAVDDTVIPAGDAIVSLNRLKADGGEIFDRRPGRTGVHLEAGDDISDIEPFLSRLSLIALEFPAFTDGRAYSKAVRLRQHHGFSGEIRAVGDVLLDQVAFMQRCGFDALEVSHDTTVERLRRNDIPAVKGHYQPALDPAKKAPTYSWRRNSAPAA